VVVNCAGQWAREVGRLAGVAVPDLFGEPETDSDD
jgi:hypothetical protein